MKSLTVAHAQSLADVAKLGPFEEIVALVTLKKEVLEMESAIGTRLSQNVTKLRDLGVTWQELEQRTGFSASSLAGFSERRS